MATMPTMCMLQFGWNSVKPRLKLAMPGMSKMKTCQHAFSQHVIANMHSAADRHNKDRSKFLKAE